MKIRDLVESIEENITVKIDGKNLSEEMMDLKIKEINIKTERKVESLESLGYSFEAGV
jgi:hypothetical protein